MTLPDTYAVPSIRPDISLIIPTYNRADFLGEAIGSALAYPGDNVEILVVDDGSTDDTRDVVGQLGNPRLKYLYQDNQGATAAMNCGLANTTGRYVGLLGSDDWYDPAALRRLFLELDSRPALGALAGGYHYVDPTGARLGEERPWVSQPTLDLQGWLFACPVLLQAGLFRREWLTAVGGFDERIQIAQDWDLGVRLAAAGCPMAWLPIPVFYYRQHPGNSVRQTKRVLADMTLVLDHLFERADLSPEIHAQRGAAYARVHLLAAMRFIDACDDAAAEEQLARAVEIDPSLSGSARERLVATIVGWAFNDMRETDAASFVERVVHCLPPTLARTDLADAIRVEYQVATLFARGPTMSKREPVRALTGLLRRDPRRLWERGILVAAARALATRQATDPLLVERRPSPRNGGGSGD